MKNKQDKIENEKKEWNAPDFFLLDFKKTQGGEYIDNPEDTGAISTLP